MQVFQGSLYMPRNPENRVHVEVDLTEERCKLVSGDVQLADWTVDEMVVNAQPDGFHIRAEGEEIILELDRDAEFALAMGLRTGPPLLVRKMSSLLREPGE